MNFLLFTAIILAIKVPILCSCWYLYRIIHDVPEPEIENDGGEFVRMEFDQGPRRRGPHGGLPGLSVADRRSETAHERQAPSELPLEQEVVER